MPRPLRRWTLLAGFWILQALVLAFGHVLIVGTFGGGGIEAPDRYDFEDVFSGSYGVRLWGVIAGLTLLQGLLVFPWRLEVAARRRGKPVLVSLAAAGMLLAVLLVAFVAALCDLVVQYELYPNIGWQWGYLWAGLGLSWAVFTALLVAYAHRSSRTNADLITRVARVIFAGTLVETAALIPLDVMIRRKTECYCWSGTFLVLNLCGAVGLIVAGPAIFLPLLARRPRHLRAPVCETCGYSLSGLAPDAPCPECGTTVAET